MNRWIIFLGRFGSVLVAIGLAFFLVSLIPPAQVFTIGGGGLMPPESFNTLYERVLTPQQGLEVSVAANGTLTFYVLEVSGITIDEWLSEHPAAGFEGFLNANPSAVALAREVDEENIGYIPTKVTNVTLVLSNEGLDSIDWNYEVSITSVVAPGTKVRNLALWAVPLGVALTLPWLTQLWKEKKANQTSVRN